jgi:hypothetical protein
MRYRPLKLLCSLYVYCGEDDSAGEAASRPPKLTRPEQARGDQEALGSRTDYG